MEVELKLNDIADDLVILNRATIETLYRLDNCVDCLALYLFYYKTAKWQKTNTIKANDAYVQKSLKWGTKKIRATKETLKENGLINLVQRRDKGKIVGWFVEISYIVTKRNIEDVKVRIEDINDTKCSNINISNQNAPKSQVAQVTSGSQETNALKINNKCLNNNILNKKERKTENGYDEIINQNIENENVKEAIYEFIKMRKFIKKPMTDRALKNLLNKLKKLSSIPDEQIAILDNSINNNWSDIYELKKEAKATKNFKQQNYTQRQYTQEEIEWLEGLDE